MKWFYRTIERRFRGDCVGDELNCSTYGYDFCHASFWRAGKLEVNVEITDLAGVHKPGCVNRVPGPQGLFIISDVLDY